MLGFIDESAIRNTLVGNYFRIKWLRLTCRKHYLCACGWKLSVPKIFRIYGVKLSWENHVHADPQSQISPALSARTDYRCDASRCWAESRAIPKISRKARTQFEGEATMTPMSARLLRDRTRHRWDSMEVVMCEIDWRRTEKCKVKSWGGWAADNLKIINYHLNHFGIDRLGDNVIVVVDVLNHLLKSTSFHFLPFQVIQWLGEVEEYTALTNLFDEKLLSFVRVSIYRGGRVDKGFNWWLLETLGSGLNEQNQNHLVNIFYFFEPFRSCNCCASSFKTCRSNWLRSRARLGLLWHKISRWICCCCGGGFAGMLVFWCGGTGGGWDGAIDGIVGADCLRINCWLNECGIPPCCCCFSGWLESELIGSEYFLWISTFGWAEDDDDVGTPVLVPEALLSFKKSVLCWDGCWGVVGAEFCRWRSGGMLDVILFKLFNGFDWEKNCKFILN